MSLLQLVFPKRCFTCDAILNEGELQLCTTCRHNLPVLTQVKLQYYLKQFNFKLKNILYFDVLFLFEKQSAVQELIHKLKYKHYRHIGKLIGSWQLNNIRSMHQKLPIDYIIPIPIHKKRLRKRGYNQLEKYGEYLSETLQIPMRTNLLIKTKYHRRLAVMNYNKRELYIKHSFKILDPSQLNNKHVLILDDIITTGATINEVIDTLNISKNCQISVACMALTTPED